MGRGQGRDLHVFFGAGQGAKSRGEEGQSQILPGETHFGGGALGQRDREPIGKCQCLCLFIKAMGFVLFVIIFAPKLDSFLCFSESEKRFFLRKSF